MKLPTIVAVMMLMGFVRPDVQGPVVSALNQYARGEHDGAIRSLSLTMLTVEDFMFESDRWIAAGADLERDRRTVIAATLGLEALRAATRFPRSGGPSQLSMGASGKFTDALAPFRVIAWGCARMSDIHLPAVTTRWWWLSSVALLEQSHDWSTLMGWTRLTSAEKLPADLLALLKRELEDGHLAHARAHVPDEPRLRMAAALGEIEKADVGFYERSTRPDVLRNIETWQKRRGNGGFDRIERALGTLVTDPQLSGEAELRLGYFDLRRQLWDAALAHLDRARPRVEEPALRAGVDYFAGWIYERTNRPDRAVEAYRRASGIVPHMRNVTMLLAAQLFLANQREEAYALLDGLAHTTALPPDPLTVLRDADARFLAPWMTRLREAVR